ncbi:MAG: hypothetical protein PHV08_06960 [Sulfurovaceae bacterium]|nr:hypothetical protein [Sulfurovaceae bacterium]
MRKYSKRRTLDEIYMDAIYDGKYDKAEELEKRIIEKALNKKNKFLHKKLIESLAVGGDINDDC